jgi:hypothetical protein
MHDTMAPFVPFLKDALKESLASLKFCALIFRERWSQSAELTRMSAKVAAMEQNILALQRQCFHKVSKHQQARTHTHTHMCIHAYIHTHIPLKSSNHSSDFEKNNFRRTWEGALC